MFGRTKPVYFDAYGSRRTRWRMPRWLILLLLGTAAGAGAVLVVQERYLPPRLSATESSALRLATDQAEADRTRLRHELAQTQAQLQAASADQKRLGDELAAARSAETRLREDLASVVATLPPDPREGAVAVRAGRFTVKAGQLNYDLVLTRQRSAGKPAAGMLKLLVAGESGRGGATTLEPKAMALQGGSHEVVRGSLPLPEGFQPRQTTVQVLDAAAGRPVGMRVLLVQ